MVVFEDHFIGTIGGGRLEFDAIAHARELASRHEQTDRKVVRLGPEIGQCCGGKVELEFRRETESSGEILENGFEKPVIHIFGGGHVGSALAKSFSVLPVSVTLVETRKEYLRDLPETIEPLELAVPEAAVRSAVPQSAFIIVTHDHALDFLIAQEALKRGDAAYVGMIGSKSKRAVLEKTLRIEKIDPTPLHCPIGQAGLGDKRPEVIAAFVVAEVLLKFAGR